MPKRTHRNPDHVQRHNTPSPKTQRDAPRGLGCEWLAEQLEVLLTPAIHAQQAYYRQLGLRDARFKSYDLPGILGNLEIEPWTEAGFMRSLLKTADSTGQPIPKGRFKHCLAFMKLRSYREERLNWKFTYPGDLQPIADAWKVEVLTGIQVWQPENSWIGEINNRLKKQALVCYVLRRPVAEVRSRLRLPMHFAIYPISDQYSFHDPTAPYSIALSQSALLLDTLAYSFKSQGGEIWIA